MVWQHSVVEACTTICFLQGRCLMLGAAPEPMLPSKT